MAKLKSFVLVLLVALLTPFTTQAGKPLRVLAIGNSFSEDAIEQNLHELCEAAGMEIVIGNLYIGGCTLQRHWTNAEDSLAAYRYRKIGTDGHMEQFDKTTLATALKDEQWDYVSLQQASGVSGVSSTYEPFLTQLISFVRLYAPHSRIVWHQTWAYAQDATHPEFVNYGRSQQRMYEMICESARKAIRDHHIRRLVPSGTAIQNARTSWIGDKMNRDGYHLNLTYGRYTAACTWFEALTGRNVVGNSYAPAGMNDRTKLTAQKAAHYAVKHPWRVTRITVPK